VALQQRALISAAHMRALFIDRAAAIPEPQTRLPEGGSILHNAHC